MSGSLRDRFVEPLGDNEPAEDSQSEYEDYESAERGQQGSRREHGIAIHYEDGETVEILSYNYIMRVVMTGDSHITIMGTDGVHFIRGQNLTGLLPLLQDHKLRTIKAYIEGKHPEPAANEQAIFSIEYLTNEDWYELVRKRREARDIDAQA